MLFWLYFLLENNLIYLLMLLMARYVFLEKIPNKKKYRTFYIVTFLIVTIISVVFENAGQVLAILFGGAAITIGREKKRVSGFFIAFPIIGIINGLMIPLTLLPTVMCDMSYTATLVYNVIIYIILYAGILLFWMKGKQWRDKFEQESNDRHLHKWEFALLGLVSVFMMTFSYINQLILINQSVNNEFTDYIKTAFSFMSIISFVLTMLVIILIVQENKLSFYHKQSLIHQKIAEQRLERVERMSLQMIRTLANTIEAKDSYTNGHSARVAKYSVMIAKRMGYENDELKILEYTALLHDIGKIGIPNEIINKPSRLADEEYEVIKKHPRIGSKILEEISEIPDIAIGAKYHHERFDGRGYPDKLSGNNIPEIARIIGVADAYDAMTSNRSYRDVLPQDVVRAEIKKGKGTQFDPIIADAMLGIMDEDVSYDLHE